MTSEEIGAGLANGGKAIGAGFILLVVVRFVQWAAQFLAGRLDARQARVDAKEAEVDGKLVQRVRKLEHRVARLDRAATILIAEVRAIDAGNPKLAMVHRILDESIPLDPDTPDELEEIARRAK